VDKTVYSGTILICLVLILGSGWFPDNAAMWLASTSVTMNIARGVIVALMLGLLVTDPPRRQAFRALLGVTALGFLVAAYTRLYSGSINIVDAVLFLEAAISFGLAALEGQPITRPAKVAMQPLERYAENDHMLFRRSFQLAAADGSGMLAIPRHTPAALLSKSIMTISVISGALYQGNHSFRSLWRGS
jgi:hypothetical protein